jgi:hypothetical protein
MYRKSDLSPVALSSDTITRVMQLELKQIEAELVPTRIALLLARRRYDRGSRVGNAGLSGSAIHSRKVAQRMKVKGPAQRTIDVPTASVRSDLAVS